MKDGAQKAVGQKISSSARFVDDISPPYGGPKRVSRTTNRVECTRQCGQGRRGKEPPFRLLVEGETPRQGSDQPILRTTEVLLGSFSRGTLWTRSRQVAKAKAATRRLVSQSILDLQRCHRRGTPRNPGPSDFIHVPAASRSWRNSPPYPGPHAKYARPRRMNWPNSS